MFFAIQAHVQEHAQGTPRAQEKFEAGKTIIEHVTTAVSTIR